MAKIMIAEDDESIRRELEQLLLNAGYQTEVVTDFCETCFLHEIFTAEPDLILLDLKLPGADGLSLCGRIRQESDIPIIFVTGNHAPMDELNCIMRGGDDYITKPYQVPILLARIAAVLRRTGRQVAKEPAQMEYRGVLLDMAAAQLSFEGKTRELTRNELKILYCLFKNPGKIVSRAELLDYLWENEVFIDDNSLSVNVTRIRGKLEELGVPELIQTRRGLGYQI